MTAIDQAEEFYSDLGVSLVGDIAHHMKHGYVHITPKYMLLGHAVRRDGGLPERQIDVKKPDAWYVRFALGVNWLQHFLNLTPYPLPYIGWARVKKGRPVKYYKAETLTQKIHNGTRY